MPIASQAPQPPENEKPFILELRHENVQRDGTFTPSAAVLVSQNLRESGLPQSLKPEDFQTLLLVLSCVTANGSFVATAELLAPVAGVSSNRMLARLRQLTHLRWREEPVLLEQTTESGLHLFLPGPQLLHTRRSLVFPPPEKPGSALEVPALLQEQENRLPAGLISSREAVVAYSRATYSRPRAEVEAEIERFLRGETEPATPEEAANLKMRRTLMDYGVTGEQADRLMKNHDTAAIERQLSWLPYRHARNPAGLLVAAIEGDYEAPLAVHQALAAVGREGELDRVQDGGATEEQDAPDTWPEGELSLPWPDYESPELPQE